MFERRGQNEEEKSTHKGLVVVVLVAVVSLLPTVSAQGPPVDDQVVHAYAYTSENHLFLLGQNTSMFGSTLNIVHNCQDLEIYVDGFFSSIIINGL